MKKLTKAQELAQQETVVALIEKNAPILFDIENAISIGRENKEKLDALNTRNAEIVELQRAKCLADHTRLKEFLGVHSGIVGDIGEVHNEQKGYFYFTVGVGDDDKLHISYYFLREWWKDSDNFERIYDKEYPTYYSEDLEAWNNSVGETENFSSLERLFEDNDYVNLLEKFVTKSIINS